MNTHMLENCRIFIAEDEPMAGIELASELQSVGAIVIGPLGRVEDALEFAQSGEYDIAILDVALQGMDAYSVGEAIRLRGKPFLFASAKSRSSIPSDFQDVPYWLKPFSPQKLAKTLAMAWQSGGSQRPA